MEGPGRFRVIPAVDLKDGKCVTLVGGDPAKRLMELDNPLKAARFWERQGASVLHLIDLDGALGGLPANLRIVEEIVQALRIPVQFGGGIRSIESARRLLGQGIHRVILGTLALEHPPVISELTSEFGSERVMVALDFRKGRVLTHGWQSTTDVDIIAAARGFEDRGAGSLLLTNVEVEGRLRGMPLGPVRRIVDATQIEVIASGGISTLRDILSVRKTGAAGAVVGAAIYTGRLDLRQAIEAAE